MKKKFKFIVLTFICLLFLGLFGFFFYNVKVYLDTKSDLKKIENKLKKNEEKLGKLDELNNMNIFEYMKLKQEKQTEIKEYEVWLKRVNQIKEKMAKSS